GQWAPGARRTRRGGRPSGRAVREGRRKAQGQAPEQGARVPRTRRARRGRGRRSSPGFGASVHALPSSMLQGRSAWASGRVEDSGERLAPPAQGGTSRTRTRPLGSPLKNTGRGPQGRRERKGSGKFLLNPCVPCALAVLFSRISTGCQGAGAPGAGSSPASV